MPSPDRPVIRTYADIDRTLATITAQAMTRSLTGLSPAAGAYVAEVAAALFAIPEWSTPTAIRKAVWSCGARPDLTDEDRAILAAIPAEAKEYRRLRSGRSTHP